MLCCCCCRFVGLFCCCRKSAKVDCENAQNENTHSDWFGGEKDEVRQKIICPDLRGPNRPFIKIKPNQLSNSPFGPASTHLGRRWIDTVAMMRDAYSRTKQLRSSVIGRWFSLGKWSLSCGYCLTLIPIGVEGKWVGSDGNMALSMFFSKEPHCSTVLSHSRERFRNTNRRIPDLALIH